MLVKRMEVNSFEIWFSIFHLRIASMAICSDIWDQTFIVVRTRVCQPWYEISTSRPFRRLLYAISRKMRIAIKTSKTTFNNDQPRSVKSLVLCLETILLDTIYIYIKNINVFRSLVEFGLFGAFKLKLYLNIEVHGIARLKQNQWCL